MQGMPGRAATTRIAWIADNSSVIRLLREPLLAELTALGHKVLVIAPEMSDADRLALLAHAIEYEPLSSIESRYGFFSDLTARRRLAQQLMAWSTRIVVAEGDKSASLAIAAARHAGIAHICPIAPAIENVGSVAEMLRAFRGQSPSLARTREAARRIAEASAARERPPAVLPLALLTETQAAKPLPGLDAGFVFCGVSDPGAGLFEAAVDRLKSHEGLGDGTRLGRARFKALHFGVRPPAVGSLENVGSDDGQRTTGLCASHVVVIDGETPRHDWALAQALILGRPVLAIDTPLTRDLIDSGASGWLVPRDADALAAALMATLKRPDLLPGMAQSARRKAERRFDRVPGRNAVLEALGLRDTAPQAAGAGQSSA